MSSTEPVEAHGDGRDEPEERIDQINPDGILHSLDASDTVCVGMDIQLREPDVSFEAPC